MDEHHINNHSDTINKQTLRRQQEIKQTNKQSNKGKNEHKRMKEG